MARLGDAACHIVFRFFCAKPKLSNYFLLNNIPYAFYNAKCVSHVYTVDENILCRQKNLFLLSSIQYVVLPGHKGHQFQVQIPLSLNVEKHLYPKSIVVVRQNPPCLCTVASSVRRGAASTTTCQLSSWLQFSSVRTTIFL